MFERMLRPSRRHSHERVSQNDNEEGASSSTAADANAGERQSSSGSGPSIAILSDNDSNRNSSTVRGIDGQNHSSSSPQHDLNLVEEIDEGVGEEANSSSSGDNPSASDTFNNENGPFLQPLSSSSDSEAEEEGTLQPNPTTHPFLTSQIQTERDLRYRRQSTCTLLILFFLIRLWFEAIYTHDAGLIFLSMMGTTWTYRWIMSRREAEEEYDRQIMEERNNNNATRGEGSTASNGEGGQSSSGADAAVNFDPDLGLMSFQAQLALAILESQRQMIDNGGYGGNERNNHDDGPGVTNEAKKQWKVYEWGECEKTTAQLAGMSRSSSMTDIKRTGSGSNYGSVGTIDLDADEDISLEKDKLSFSKLEGGLLTSFDYEEEPSCSICLCEYECGEKVSRLPCDHVYHESCLNSWTENHIRCPLCNYDLMDGFEQPVCVQQRQQHAEEQRAFRNLALSTLGRRIRTQRRSSRRAAAGNRGTSAAALVAAAEDSIV